MNENKFIDKYKNLNLNKFINSDQNNLEIFMLKFILNENSKILQIGNISNESEKIIKKTFGNRNYVIMKDCNFNFYEIQSKNNIFFNTLIISNFNKTFHFLEEYVKIFDTIKYLFLWYKDKTKLCDSIRIPLLKKNFGKLLNFNYDISDNIGAKSKNKKIKYEIMRKCDFKGEFGIFKFSYGIDNLNRTSIINHLIKKYKFNNYLEIGVGDGLNYNKIKIQNKSGIDPNPSKECKDNVFLMTSEEYFDYIKNENLKFDIIFIDGLNLEHQVTKDIYNSLKYLSKNGFIILSKTNPTNKSYQSINFIDIDKNSLCIGTSWKSIVKLRMLNSEISIFTLNTEFGLSIIYNKKSKKISNFDKINYTFLSENRENLLNIISIYEFLSIF